MVISASLPRLLGAPRQSFFLFGPRGSGKSTWAREHFAQALWIDLLDEGLYHELLARPSGFADRLRTMPNGKWVVVDEVQRLPSLLNEVHRFIEERRLRFVLSGSSARKLRQAGVNLLAGRALRRTMHPFLPHELGKRFSLEGALRVGTLPVILASSEPEQALTSYVQSYLREEIQAAALVRNLPGFARFLPVAGLMHGQLLNVSGLARDAQVSRTTVNDYVAILEDTLLAFRLPGYEARLRLRERKLPKLYWVDAGLARAARGESGSLGALDRGPLFEGLVANLLRAWNDYRGLYEQMSYWAPSESSLEVDFLLRRGRKWIAIEAKSSARLRPEDARGLEAIAALKGVERRLLVYPTSPALRLASGVEVLGFGALCELLDAGRL